MVNVPVRGGPEFATTVKPIVLLPLPLAADVIVSHDAWLVAVHAQPALAVRLTSKRPGSIRTSRLRSICEMSRTRTPMPPAARVRSVALPAPGCGGTQRGFAFAGFRR